MRGNIFNIKLINIVIMNIYFFWILFLGLWEVPLMIIKGKKDNIKQVKTSPEVKPKKKGWFN